MRLSKLLVIFLASAAIANGVPISPTLAGVCCGSSSRPIETTRVAMHNRLIQAANTAAQRGDFSRAVALYRQTLTYARDHCDRASIKYSIRAAQETAKKISTGTLARSNGGDEFERRQDQLWMQDPCDRP